MRRKDLLSIIIAVVVISFITVGIIYLNTNGNLNISENNTTKGNGKFYSNGWETSIVAEIKNGVPIPTGFKYLEGGENGERLKIEDSVGQQYMWIPYVEPEYIVGSLDEELESKLDRISEERMASIKKYGGFYIAIESVEREFTEYLLANNASEKEIYEAKEFGYYGYETKLHEQGISLTSIDDFDEAKKEKLKLINQSKTNSTETHLMSAEELTLVQDARERTVERINLKDYKSLTILGASEKIELETNQETVDVLIEYAAKVSGANEDIIKMAIGYDEDIDYNEDEEAYRELIDKSMNYVESNEEYKRIIQTAVEEGYINTADLEVIEKDENEENEETEEGSSEENDDTEDLNKEVVNQGDWDRNIVANIVENIPIPKGFEYVEGNINTGFKIKNGENLKFVWVPVKVSEDKSVGELVKEELIAKLEESGADSELEVDKYKEYVDEIEGNEEYEELVKSIELYGGFYISEAELGYDSMGSSTNIYRPMYSRYGEGTGKNYVSDGDYYRNINDENLYYKDTEGNLTRAGKIQSEFDLSYESAIEKCKELYSVSESVVSHLTYGLEYDAAILYLLEKGVLNLDQAFNDSNAVGKYWTEDEGVKETLWYSPFNLNGIYGLGGNLAEITRERDGQNVIIRGGSWKVDGKTEKLAGKVSKTPDEILSDEDTMGFRACLYIKTEYEDIEEELESLKEEAKADLKAEVEGITVINEETKENIFNVEIPAVQKIIEETEEKIASQINNATIRTEAYNGLEQIEMIAAWMETIINYPKEEVLDYEFTWGPEEEKAKCDKLKVDAIEKIKQLTWEEGEFKYGDEPVTLDKITKEALDGITNVRQEYRKKIIEEQIKNYDAGSDGEEDKDYITTIKERAQGGMLNYTEDFDKLDQNAEDSIIKQWQDIMDTAVDYDKNTPDSEEKNNNLDKIANEATTKEEAEEIVNNSSNNSSNDENNNNESNNDENNNNESNNDENNNNESNNNESNNNESSGGGRRWRWPVETTFQ